MGLFQKKIGPVFLKEESDATGFIEKMKMLENQVSDSELKAEIEKQIKLASYGEFGEKNISFELKNSGMDMYILHDIYLEYNDLSAQIDYLIITRKRTYIIECKNLIGNIEIDNQGNFIRTYELFGKKVKEGIYSPITQNKRHLEVLKNVRRDSKTNILMKAAFDHYFENNYKSIVVLANPKTYLNSKFAKKEVKDQVIRADQLISKIKELDSQYKDGDSTENEMLDLAKFFLSVNKSERSDYSKKYEQMAANIKLKFEEVSSADIKVIKSESVITDNESSKSVKLENDDSKSKKICPKCGAEMVLRVAAKGPNAGNKFYGCSGFPKCRNIENVE